MLARATKALDSPDRPRPPPHLLAQASSLLCDDKGRFVAFMSDRSCAFCARCYVTRKRRDQHFMLTPALSGFSCLLERQGAQTSRYLFEMQQRTLASASFLKPARWME